MKKLFLTVLSFALPFAVMAQEVVEYQNDDTVSVFSRYELPAQKGEQFSEPQNGGENKFHTSINTGVGVGNGGSYEYVNPKFSVDVSKRLQISAGVGVMFSNFKVGNVSSGETPTYQTLRAMSNFYSLQAEYKATERLLVTGSLIYGNNSLMSGSQKYKTNFDSYIATFGAVYQITPSFSVGFEVSRYQNASPFYMPYSRF